MKGFELLNRIRDDNTFGTVLDEFFGTAGPTYRFRTEIEQRMLAAIQRVYDRFTIPCNEDDPEYPGMVRDEKDGKLHFCERCHGTGRIE